MNITDIEYGKVLTTGEIAFYLSIPKGRIITERAKTEFLSKWIAKRLKSKRDNSAIRKYLQSIRKDKRLAAKWSQSLYSFLSHIESCKHARKENKTDRELMRESLAMLRTEGFLAYDNVNMQTEFTDEELLASKHNGSILLLDLAEKKFEGDTLKDGEVLEFMVTSEKITSRALYVFLGHCFPIKCADRPGVFIVGSAQGQINLTLSLTS